jgi:(2Fe-2S) ferredoxin
LKPIHERHVYVEHDNVRIEIKGGTDCFLSIRGGSDDFKFSAQIVLKVCEQGPVIIYKENTNFGHNRTSSDMQRIVAPLVFEDRPDQGFANYLY